MEAAAKRSTVDRLSALPDELLRHFLSFLPAQQVVQTTVLSKRWEDQWLSVPGINLHFIGDLRRDRSVGWNRMENFTTNLLILHNAPRLDAFRFVAAHCSLPLDSRPRVDAWIRRAIKDDPLLLQVSSPFFTSQDKDYPFDLYQFPHLGSSPCRRLKTLHLTAVSLDLSFSEQLDSWFPNIEDLTIKCCLIGFSQIQSDKLKNLLVVQMEVNVQMYLLSEHLFLLP